MMQSIFPAPLNFAVQSKQPAGLHIAIIMDGNGRWAARRGLPRIAGHRAGTAAVRRTVESAPDLGVGRLTLYAFSSDNWRRPAQEVQSIFWLLRAYLRLETANLSQKGVRLEVIGRRDRLPKRLLHEIERAERATFPGRHLHLRVAIDYSSRDAIARAALAASTGLPGRQPPSHPSKPKPGPLGTPEEWWGRTLARMLTAESGDVDLLIRTGGEKRLSDFLLWESAYAELLFTDRMWPDFGAADLEAALKEFRGRERRFGGVPKAVEQDPAPMTGGAR
jgi:undecaprenyl diphosphate synthase